MKNQLITCILTIILSSTQAYADNCITDANTHCGPAHIDNITQDSLTIYGPLNLHDSELKTLIAHGPANITSSKITDLTISGPFSGENINLYNGKVLGPFKLKDSKITGDFDITGPTKLTNTQVEKNITICSNIIKLTDCKIHGDLYIHSNGRTPKLRLKNSTIEGKVIFAKNPGKITYDNSKINGEIVNIID